MSKEHKTNHTKAWCASGLLLYNAKKNEWALHHKDTELKCTNPARHNEWRVEDLEPMLKSEHARMHQLGRHLSEEHKLKISTARKGIKFTEAHRMHLKEAHKKYNQS